MANWLKELIYGRETGDHGEAARNAGMDEFMQAIKDFERDGNNQYQWLGDFAGGPELGSSEMGDISVNPQYAAFEQQTLRDLEQQSKDGLSARDLADMAQLESQVNRQNSGRIGAIQQNMAARGMGGSGMELVAQMQAAQDATERQALASLEKNAQVQQGRRDATAQLGQLSGQLSQRDWQREAQKAAAQDAINRFNTQNQWQRGMYNHQGRQGAADQNVAQNNTYQQQVLAAKQGGGQMRYNAGAEADNMAAARKQAQRNEAVNWANVAIGGGKAVAEKMGKGYAHGGEVPGQAPVPGDNPANDVVPAQLSPGEIVIPRSITQLEPGEAAKAAKLFVELTQMTKGRK